jgi:hypothetical protein
MSDYGCIPGLDLDSAALLRVNVQSNQAKMRRMPRFAAYLLGAAIALVFYSQTTSLQTAADTRTSTLKNRIPSADPAVAFTRQSGSTSV